MDWKINPVMEQCSACRHPFGDGEPYFSTLQLDETSAARRDWCTSCFKPDDGADRIFWKAKNICKDPEMKRVVDFGILREFFFKMLSHGGAAFVPMTYLVGLVLVRKKFLRFVDFVSCDGRDVMRVQRRRGEPCFDVETPLLDEEGIAQLKEKLADLLSADIGADFDLAGLDEPAREEPHREEPHREEPVENVGDRTLTAEEDADNR